MPGSAGDHPDPPECVRHGQQQGEHQWSVCSQIYCTCVEGKQSKELVLEVYVIDLSDRPDKPFSNLKWTDLERVMCVM